MDTSDLRPISNIFPSLGSRGKKESTFPSSVIFELSTAYDISPSMAFIYLRENRVDLILSAEGAVGNGKL